MVIESAPFTRWVDRRPSRFRAGPLAGVALLALVAVAPASHAQSNGKGFLFKQPAGSFSLRAGYALANASSGVFDDATSLLTLDKRDFSALDWGGDIAASVRNKLDIGVDVEVSSASRNSEFRDWVDNNDQPIEQATKFVRVPLTLGVRYYPFGRGRSISQFAYIPSRYAPYVSVGAGAMYYQFKQNGDFVDFQTLDVRTLTVESAGWTPMGRGSAGLEYSIGPWLALTGEARYVWAKAKLDEASFVGYDKIDLTGYTGTLGFRVRF